MISAAGVPGLVFALTSTPTPSTPPGFDPDSVTPGAIGFLITFLVAVVTVLLILDMTRRIRRTQYREEIANKLDAEHREDAGEAAERAD